MFEQYANGVSLHAIAGALNAEGKRFNGKPFTGRTFEKWIRNEKYTGVFSFGNRRCDNMYPAHHRPRAIYFSFDNGEKPFLASGGRADVPPRSISITDNNEATAEAIKKSEVLDASSNTSDAGGGGGIRTPVPLPANGFQDRLVMTASIRLRADFKYTKPIKVSQMFCKIIDKRRFVKDTCIEVII